MLILIDINGYLLYSELENILIEIVPAIIARDFSELQMKVKLVEPYACPEPDRGINWVQLDVMDDKFTPQITDYQPEDLKKLNTKLNLEAHLMIFKPEKAISRWIASGVKRILIHVESTNETEVIIKKIKHAGLEAGIVLNLETPIENIDNIQYPISNIQVIQLMAIEKIGYHGHPFDEQVIPKIRSLRARYLDVKIAVDGGINNQTAKKLIQAGADILVVGSAVFRSRDIGKTIYSLKNINNL